MSKPKRIPAIARLVAHNGGPAALATKIDAKHQQVHIWLARGWATSVRFLQLEPLMPPGMTVADLYEDRTMAQKKAKRHVAAAPRPAVKEEAPPTAAGEKREAQAQGRRRYDTLPPDPTLRPVAIPLKHALLDRRETPERRQGPTIERRKR